MDQKGISAITVVFIVIAVLVVGGGVWYLAQEPEPEPVVTDDPDPVITDDLEMNNDVIAEWQTYQDDQYGVEFKYPADWEAETYYYGTPVMMMEEERENIGFTVSKKDEETGQYIGRIVWGGPQSAGDNCEFLINAGRLGNNDLCFDFGSMGWTAVHVEIGWENEETRRVFSVIEQTIRSY